MKNEFEVVGNFKKYIFTIYVCVLIIITFIATKALSTYNGIEMTQIFSEYGFNKSAILGGEYYRLLTMLLLHGGIIHLMTNVMVILIFGSFIEKKIGTIKMISLTIISLVSIWIFKILLSSNITSIGISSYGCFLLTYILIRYFKEISKPSRNFIFQYIVIVVITTLLIPFISISGHFSGLFSGFIIGWFVCICSKLTSDKSEIEI